MKKLVLMVLAVALVLSLSATAQERKPMAVSPGLDGSVAVVSVTCPTFSWAAVPSAQSYRIAVFKWSDAAVPAYWEMEAVGVAVLVKDIAGEALSWTPSASEALAGGGEYAWFVQAIDGAGAGAWSAGRAFKVDVPAGFVGVASAQARTNTNAKATVEVDVPDYLKSKDMARLGAVPRTAGSGAGPVPLGNETGWNTYYGEFAGGSITSGFDLSLFGQYAGAANTTGSNNTFIGYYAGRANTTGGENTFVGDYAGRNNVTHSGNTYVGYYAGYKTTAEGNAYFGGFSGYNNLTGYSNSFFGYRSGYRNTDGFRNTFVGDSAGYENTTGTRNVFIGYYSGVNNTIGLANTFFGDATGSGNVTGIRNTYIGYGAGNTNNSGHYNVCIGTYAGFYNTVSNRLYVANTDTTTPLLYGEFDNAKLTVYNYLGVGIVPTQRIHVVGGAYCNGTTWVNASSRDYKENILSLDAAEALATLNGLNPVKFNYKEAPGDPQVGFIAEDVPDLVATQDRKGMSAMDVVAVLTKVVQEQQSVIEDLKARIAKLEAAKK